MNVLMLHDVRPFDNNFFPERYKQHSFLTDDEFANGISILEKDLINFDYIVNSEIANGIEVMPEKYALTFDDGLKDHIWVAQYLADKKITAAFFIPFGVIQEKTFIHSHLIQFLIASGELKSIAFDLHKLLQQECKFTDNQILSYKISKWKNNLWSEDEVFITRVLREVFSFERRDHILKSLSKKYLKIDLAEIHDSFYLSDKDIRLIAEMGHYIGSHGYYSLDLRYESQEVAQCEIVRSYDFLNEYDNQIKTISYPNGGFSDLIRNIVSSTGFQYGFGTTHCSINIDDDALHLPRLDGTKLGIFK